MACDLLGDLLDTLFELLRWDNLAGEADAPCFLSLDHPGAEDELFRAGRTDQVDQAGIVAHREAVAQSARDRNAEACVGRADAEIARQGDAGPAADGIAADRRDRRASERLESPDHCVHALLVL